MAPLRQLRERSLLRLRGHGYSHNYVSRHGYLRAIPSAASKSSAAIFRAAVAAAPVELLRRPSFSAAAAASPPRSLASAPSPSCLSREARPFSPSQGVRTCPGSLRADAGSGLPHLHSPPGSRSMSKGAHRLALSSPNPSACRLVGLLISLSPSLPLHGEWSAARACRSRVSCEAAFCDSLEAGLLFFAASQMRREIGPPPIVPVCRQPSFFVQALSAKQMEIMQLSRTFFVMEKTTSIFLSVGGERDELGA